MASRHENRRYGRGGGRYDETRRFERGRGGWGSGWDRSTGQDEGYFGGGSMGYGEGYRDQGYRGGGSYGGFDREGERGYRSSDSGFRGDYDRREDLTGGGMYGGGFGGYTGGGSQGWTPGGPSNYGGTSYGRPGRSDLDQGVSRSSRYYPQSERGYYDRDERDEQDERGWLERAGDEVASWFGDEDAERRRRMDEQGQYGRHRGRGPRNYTRSDDRIREDINDRFTDNDYLDASDIEVEVQGGDIVLTGMVETRYEKRLAEDLAERVSGARNVENRIRVKQNTWSNNSQFNDTSSTTMTPSSVSTGSGYASGTSTGSSESTGTTGTTGTANTSNAAGRSRGRAAGS